MDSSAAACRSGQLGVARLFALSELFSDRLAFLAESVKKNPAVYGEACGMPPPPRRTHANPAQDAPRIDSNEVSTRRGVLA